MLGGAQAVQGLRLGRPRLLPDRRRDRRQFSAQTLDNKPVKGKGELKLLKVSYDADKKPVEKEVQKWELDTDDQGRARQQIKADEPGQYRLSYTVTDDKGHAIEGGYVFVVRGEGFNGKEFRFNDIELDRRQEGVPGRRHRQADDQHQPRRRHGACCSSARPTASTCRRRSIRLKGKSTVEEIGVVKKDMPNFFVEAVTVSDGKVLRRRRARSSCRPRAGW